MKKPPQKVAYLSRNSVVSEIFYLLPNEWPTAQMAEFMFQNMAYRATVYITGQQPSEELRILEDKKPEANRNQKRKQLERDMAITLVAISLMFVICQSIKLIVDIYELTVCDFSKIAIEGYDPECHNPTQIDVFASLGNLFVCINSAANFLVYMIKGKRFREAFCHSYFSCSEENIPANLQVQLNVYQTEL